MRLYGEELIKKLENDISRYREAIDERFERVNEGLTDWDDCFMSQRCEERGINNCINKINLIKDGGCSWFNEYATLDGVLVKSRWCNTRYGLKLRAEMPDGSVVWTSSTTRSGLKKKGLKMVECLRPAWFSFKSGNSGLLGVYTGDYVMFPSDFNYATGEEADSEPLEVRDVLD